MSRAIQLPAKLINNLHSLYSGIIGILLFNKILSGSFTLNYTPRLGESTCNFMI